MSESHNEMIPQRRNPLVIVGEAAVAALPTCCSAPRWHGRLQHRPQINYNGIDGMQRAAMSTMQSSAGCGVTAGVLVVGLLAFKQVCGSRSRRQHAQVASVSARFRPPRPSLINNKRIRAAQGNSQLSQKMMRARVMAQVCCWRCSIWWHNLTYYHVQAHMRNGIGDPSASGA